MSDIFRDKVELEEELREIVLRVDRIRALLLTIPDPLLRSNVAESLDRMIEHAEAAQGELGRMGTA